MRSDTRPCGAVTPTREVSEKADYEAPMRTGFGEDGCRTKEIQGFITSALAGEILDAKAKKQVEKLMPIS